MKMALGENIRNLRNAQHITQEQLAEALNVSPQAVSRWENENTFPDISVVPILVNFFEVTTDYLLGVDTVHRQEEIERILKQDMEYKNEGRTQDRIKLMRESLSIYPNEAKLLDSLAASLYSYCYYSGIEHTKEEEKRVALEIIELCKRAIKYSKEICIKDACKQLMVFCYTKMGEFEKAEEIAVIFSGR